MGNFVQASSQTPLAVITQLQPIAVIFPVPQDDIFRVQQKFNSKEDVVVEAWNETVTTKLASGKLLAIDNQVDTTTGTVKLKAIFQNEDNHLFPNEFVSMKLLIDTRHDVVIVPNAAVQHGPTSTFVYVVKPDKTVTMRPVTPGPSQSGQTIIDKGVAPGEIVVTEGTDKLQEKSKVQLPGEKSGDKTGEKAGGKSNKNAQASPAPKTEG